MVVTRSIPAASIRCLTLSLFLSTSTLIVFKTAIDVVSLCRMLGSLPPGSLYTKSFMANLPVQKGGFNTYLFRPCKTNRIQQLAR